jgi:hypothetical protein
MKFEFSSWALWGTWIEKIASDVSTRLNDAAQFGVFRKTVAENSGWIDRHQGGAFCQFVTRSYVTAASLGVRRHVKRTDSNSIALARLLEQIAKCAPQITFGFYQLRFPRAPNDIEWQASTFGRLCADPAPLANESTAAGVAVSASIVEGDLAKLDTLTQTIEEYADRVLAHLDKRGFSTTFTFAELDQALHAFDELVCKYQAFLTGSAPNSHVAVALYSRERIFTVPWKQPTTSS